MPVIAIVGAGPGIGLHVGRLFGKKGFDVALIARNQSRLDGFVTSLGEDGISARAYSADITEPASLQAALTAARADLGRIDVLEFGPNPGGAGAERYAPVDAVDVTLTSVVPQFDFYVGGGITAVQAVLPDMIEHEEGTILITNGASAGVIQYPALGSYAIAAGALRNWTLNLHEALKPRGIYAAHVAIATLVGKAGVASQPETIARSYWELYQKRDRPELLYWDDEVMGPLLADTKNSWLNDR